MQVKENVWSVTNRIIKTKPLAQPPSTLLLEDGSYTTNSTDTAHALLHNFFPSDTQDTIPAQVTTRTLMAQPIHTPPEPPFTNTEVLNGIKHMSHKKAPGIEHLTADICLQFVTHFPDYLTKIYNRYLDIAYFPSP